MPDAAALPAPRRSDADHIRLTARDITGLLLCAEHYAAPYDLLAAALDAQPARLRGIVARWRAAGPGTPARRRPAPARPLRPPTAHRGQQDPGHRAPHPARKASPPESQAQPGKTPGQAGSTSHRSQARVRNAHPKKRT
jgi:hypothetical protein